MTRLKQVFKNNGERSLILFLELSTARYRLAPGQEVTLYYEDSSEADGAGAPLRIEYETDQGDPQLTIYTDEDTMFLADGAEAETDYS
ncbi:hypothetical protein K9B35_10405 [Sphingomonas sp. R647]|uniref:hypothetical protein n=1 Tax=Sphingomonas sp. R647 TaxID=2875233 RepID=UPI001CD66FE0|nr:hypothetical protein [Sphingomonas sp. R647]MCA1198380.1 hypothetical protein [Sphingomonas sp. R647]